MKCDECGKEVSNLNKVEEVEDMKPTGHYDHVCNDCLEEGLKEGEKLSKKLKSQDK